MNKNDLILIRDALEGDFNFILATILRGLYYGKSVYSLMEKGTFMSHYHKKVVGLLASPKVKVLVACLKDDPTVILGYSIISTDETILHWVFTKSAWRKIGIAKSLIPKDVTQCTHLTEVGNKCRKQIKFNPFLL